VILRNSAGMVIAPLSVDLIVVRECKISLFFVLFVAIAMPIYHLQVLGDERRGNSICRIVDLPLGCGLVCLEFGYSLDLQSCGSASIDSRP
jgi:hypothetical protein